MESSKLVSFLKLPLGARFRYNSESHRIWIKLSSSNCGLIAEYDKRYMGSGGWLGQMICSVVSTPEELSKLEVLPEEV